MKYILFCIVLFLYFPALSQITPQVEYGAIEESDILDAPQPKRGIYQNFQELKSNSPSITEGFKESSRSGAIMTYQIRQGKKKVKKAYGFSDGQSVYINARNYNGGTYYVKLEILGRYSLFREQGGSGIGIGGAIGIGPVAIGSGGGNRIRPYILDMQNGIIELLDRKQMQLILAKDRELSQAYANEKRRTSFAVMAKYIQAFNEKAKISGQ